MLDEIKTSYYELANLIPDWKKLSGNDLCFEYMKHKEDKNAEYYLSAIIYKFWHIAVKTYHNQGLKIASPEDCYTWLVDSVTYVLEHHVWTDENHSLYNDPKAPEKAINVVYTSTKINFFVASTRQKRKVDTHSVSLDGISEDVSDAFFLPSFDKYSFDEEYLTEIIKSLYNEHKYFDAICLDIILGEDVLSEEEFEDDKQRYKILKLRLKNLDEEYSKFFSALYGIPYSDVKKSIEYITGLDVETIQMKIIRCIAELKHNKQVLRLVAN